MNLPIRTYSSTTSIDVEICGKHMKNRIMYRQIEFEEKDPVIWSLILIAYFWKYDERKKMQIDKSF